MSAFLLLFCPLVGGAPPTPPDLRSVRIGTFDNSVPERVLVPQGTDGPRFLYLFQGGYAVIFEESDQTWRYLSSGFPIRIVGGQPFLYPWEVSWPEPFYADAVNP
jgi:hypothetical protein